MILLDKYKLLQKEINERKKDKEKEELKEKLL